MRRAWELIKEIARTAVWPLRRDDLPKAEMERRLREHRERYGKENGA